ncbi:hypothetical protein Dsin_000814 [Dipteronia sinensis]|uniref:RNase H type-1 domain-containing protein n=1 Tax=Dipteronia sinensis TaxID=43782 RepID=A0AAE0B3K9_9ROSI|nr:hypothetical protein Dsin_000814 [Dipteronia sinensis]
MMIFEDAEVDVGEAVDMIKFRTTWWFKHLGRGSTDSISALLLNLKDLCVNAPTFKKPCLEGWTRPSSNGVKFNVDGLAREKPSSAGIGGVIRDYTSKVLGLFSSFVGNLDSNIVELLAIHIACSICISCASLWERDILLVRNSKVVVSWVNSKDDIESLKLVDMIYDIRA